MTNPDDEIPTIETNRLLNLALLLIFCAIVFLLIAWVTGGLG